MAFFKKKKDVQNYIKKQGGHLDITDVRSTKGGKNWKVSLRSQFRERKEQNAEYNLSKKQETSEENLGLFKSFLKKIGIID